MKKTVRKVLCTLLSLLMLVTLFVPATAESRTGGAVPTVYVQGQGAALLNTEGEKVAPAEVPDGYITDAVKACMPSFLSAITSDDWDEYLELLYSYVTPIFEEYQLDANGEPSNGVHVGWTWSRETLTDKKKNGVYGLFDYAFMYDWRLDPSENARLLNLYIQDVKAVTGSDKVNLVGRCEGGNVAMAYLAAYGSDDFNCIEFYVHSVFGVEAIGSTFSGKIHVNPESAKRYLNQKGNIQGDELNEFIAATLQLATETYTLDAIAVGMKWLAPIIYNKILKDIILVTYGTFPGYWSLVGPDDYVTARDNVFAGKQEEYAGLIAKLDDYDTRVRSKTYELLAQARDNGVKIAVFSKYGFQSIPISLDNDALADDTVTLKYSSFGATCANVGKTLKTNYLESVESNGLSRYISPEKNIDASTCFFPDTTWIIKNNEHTHFPACIDNLMLRFMHSNGEMTVNSDSAYPQYLIYDKTTDTISPMMPEDADEPEPEIPKTKESFKEMALRFVRALLNFIKQLFTRK